MRFPLRWLMAVLVPLGCSATPTGDNDGHPSLDTVHARTLAASSAHYVVDVADQSGAHLREEGAYDLASGRFWRTVAVPDGPQVRFVSDGEGVFAQLPTGEWVGTPSATAVKQSPPTEFLDLMRWTNADMSVDAHHRLRRLHVEMDRASRPLTITLELSGYGKPVEVEVPQRAEVQANNAALLHRALQFPTGHELSRH